MISQLVACDACDNPVAAKAPVMDLHEWCLVPTKGDIEQDGRDIMT